GRRLLPHERAKQTAQLMMGLPMRGLSHPARVFLATMLYYRHGGNSSDLEHILPMGLLSDDMQEEAIVLGHAMRFVGDFDPMGSKMMAQCKFHVEADDLILHLSPAAEKLWGPVTEKRFLRIAHAMGRIGTLR
ncbi:MAG: hypothetical protein AAF723_04865, partial [Pseudomonadota bacterium]